MPEALALAAAIAAVQEEADAYDDPEYPWSNEMLAHIAALRLGQRVLEALADRENVARILCPQQWTHLNAGTEEYWRAAADAFLVALLTRAAE